MPFSEAQEISSRETSFQEIFAEALIESLTPLLGESATQVIIYKLGLNDGITDPSIFHEELSLMFGSSGTLLIELRILNLLQSKLDRIFVIDSHASQSILFEKNYKLAWRAFREARSLDLRKIDGQSTET